MLELRPYQHEAVNNLRVCYAKGYKAPLFVLPTAGGKTIVFAHIVSRATQRGRRTLVVAHRAELIRRASGKLDLADVEHGIIAPWAPTTDHAIQVASVCTLARRQCREFDFLIIDEAHHSIANQYQKLIVAQPNAKLLGVTATPARLDGKGLGTEAGGPFDSLVLGPAVQELIDPGYLVPTTVYAPERQPSPRRAYQAWRLRPERPCVPDGQRKRDRRSCRALRETGARSGSNRILCHGRACARCGQSILRSWMAGPVCAWRIAEE